MSQPLGILYCHCAYAQVVPKEVKEAVLRRLTEAGIAFEAVADLCEMSARRDATLKRLATTGELKIAACYPRAVKWLFAAAQAPLSQASTEVLNMRVQTADEIVASLLQGPLHPNLPEGKANPTDAPIAPTRTPTPTPTPTLTLTQTPTPTPTPAPDPAHAG